MNYKIISLLLAFLLSISISACSNDISSSAPEGNSNKSNSSKSCDVNISSDSQNENAETQVSSKDNENSPMEAYKAVLQNKAEFFSTDTNKSVYLNDFLTNKEIYGTIFKVTHFSVLDMDGDKIPEVVLELTVGDYPEFYEVLYYMNDEVYGCIQVYRGLEMLKNDGTFWSSNGASDNECGRLKFSSNGCKTDILGYMKPSENNDTAISYSINNETVTKELFDSFMKKQNEKKDAVWYEFSENNIETELSIN